MTDLVTDRLLGQHAARLDNHDANLAELKSDLREIRDAIKTLEQIASYGRGVLWAALKLGAALALILQAALYLWERVPQVLKHGA
jgi:hypothetical protein